MDIPIIAIYLLQQKFERNYLDYALEVILWSTYGAPKINT